MLKSVDRIIRMGVGYDRLDRDALASRDVIVCNIPGTFQSLTFWHGGLAFADHRP